MGIIPQVKQRNLLYNTRVYLNIHNEDVLDQFLTEYIEECIKNKMDYHMKGIRDTNPNTNDTSVLYFDVNTLKKRVEILENIMLRHPEWREHFKEPVYGTSRFGTGFYGIGHIGGIYFDKEIHHTNNYMETYNDYYENDCKVSLGCMIANILITNGMVPSNSPNYKYLVSLKDLKNLTNSDNSIVALRNIKVEDKNIKYVSETLIEKFINDSFVQQELRKLGPIVFRDYMKKLHCFAQRMPMDNNVDIALGKYMIMDLSKDENLTKTEDGLRSVEYKNEIVKQFKMLTEKYNQLKTIYTDSEKLLIRRELMIYITI